MRRVGAFYAEAINFPGFGVRPEGGSMNSRTKVSDRAACLAVLAALLGVALAAEEPVPSQTTLGSTLTLTGEVVAVDPETRHLAVRGPLGGQVSGRVSDEVKNLDQVKVGDLLTLSYSQSVSLMPSRPGEPNPLYKGGDASTAAPGMRPEASASEQNKGTVTVVSVAPDHHEIVLRSEDGTVFPVSVNRPEFMAKLDTVRPGDQIDVVTTEAVIAKVEPAAAGSKAGMTYTESTLIVER